MLHYDDGQEVRIGDEVDVDGTHAIVFEIVESPEDMMRLGFHTQSVGFKCEEWGEIYQSTADPGWDESIVLLRRSP